MDILENKRINYLAEKFDIYDVETHDWTEYLTENPEIVLEKVSIFKTGDFELGYLHFLNEKIIKVSIPSNIFLNVIDSDPSFHKKYVQWILTNYCTMLKNGLNNEAYRLINEDLDDAKHYLTIFETVKNKKRFREVCLKNERIKNIKNPTDINQYYSLDLLYDAVDPFIERNSTGFMRSLEHMEKIGEAKITFRSRKFLVYIPKTIESSVIFNNFVGWCTTRPNNSNFNSYRKHKTYDNKPSELYIVIPMGFFNGETDEMFQFHFESKQFHNKSNVSIDLYDLLNKDISLMNYFINIFIGKIKNINTLSELESSPYMDTLIKLKLGDKLFELMNKNIFTINFVNNQNINKTNLIFKTTKNISRFILLKQLILINVGLENLNGEVGDLHNLEMISVPNNYLTDIPEEIGELRNLKFLNIKDNPIKSIPESIIKLDKSNGGSLDRIVVSLENLDNNSLDILRNKLPNAIVQIV